MPKSGSRQVTKLLSYEVALEGDRTGSKCSKSRLRNSEESSLKKLGSSGQEHRSRILEPSYHRISKSSTNGPINHTMIERER